MDKKSAILCIDDEEIVLTSLHIELRKRLGNSFIIELAQSGEDALEIVDELISENIDVILVIADYIMPSMRGDEALIRIHEKVPKAMMIMLTGQTGMDGIGNVINKADLYRYIPKPWNEADFALTVKEAVRSYLQDRQLEEQNKALQELNRTLEQKVAERTAALEANNIQLLLAKEAADKASRAKSDFLANMSHEIRTPMHSILGFTEILESRTRDEQQREFLQAININAKALLTLINDILDLSKVEAGKLDLEYAAVDPRVMFVEMKQIFFRKVADKDIEFKVEIDAAFPDAIFLDEIRLRQILLNLAGNAVKFTNSGYVKLSLHADISEKAAGFCDFIFSVEDT
ncbi:MAG: response regulator, partial [Gammaproteobacteria bacterium]|nr:response regulator [Gammaproteobacteria bacterium]